MAEVPKIVRERLSSQAAGEHPDANRLSAFAERALTEPERSQMLDHLSRCADCRQIVALTAPELTEEQVTVTQLPGASRSWWRSPLLHWGAFTAAALVVLIAVGARMRLREGRSASAPAIAPPSANEVTQRFAIPVPEVPSVPARPKQSSKKLAKPSAAQVQAPVVGAGKPGGVAGGIIGGNTDKLAGLGTGSGGGIGSGVKSAPATVGGPIAPQMKMQAKATAGAISSDTGIEQSRQKSALVPPAASETVIATGAAAPELKSKAAGTSGGNAALVKRWSVSPRWSISDSGVLQRSFDGGRSWQEVAIGDGVTFRAVATVGSDVWAGGSGAALFHSADGGEHWSQVPIQVKGRAPSGDIIRIEFADAQNGTVATSTNEIWTTSDAGTTWRSQ